MLTKKTIDIIKEISAPKDNAFLQGVSDLLLESIIIKIYEEGIKEGHRQLSSREFLIKDN